MKYLPLIILLSFLLTIQFSFAQPPSTLWVKYYDRSWGINGQGYCVIETSDSGYVVVGYLYDGYTDFVPIN